MMQSFIPKDFLAAGWNIGIKDDTLDFGVIHSKRPGSAAAVFTKNNFPGNPILVGRENAGKGRLQTIVVNSKNANVANGPDGLKLVYETCKWVGESLGIEPELVLPSSTGVIARPMPREKVLSACRDIPNKLNEAGFEDFSRAIMTTDSFPKTESRELKSGIRIAGFAKGAGMIEPNMATMLSYMITDARIDSDDLRRLLVSVADRSFNRISVDSDTSTSDTFASIANGASGVNVSFSVAAAESFQSLRDPYAENAMDQVSDLDDASREFTREFFNIALKLSQSIVRDGEGATKLIRLNVTKARTRERALKIARSIINSPLVKTAIYGADPNWGRLVMAIGKVFEEPVPMENLEIFFGDLPLKDVYGEELIPLSNYLKQSDVEITVRLNEGDATETVWGCDLTEKYVEINAYYTT